LFASFTFIGKPVMLTEYGADTVAGLHMEPSMVFTEEYQAIILMVSRDKFKNPFTYFLG